MNENKSAKNKRKKTGNNKRSDKKKDKQVNAKPEDDQTENDKIETAENSEVALSCSATESYKDDGNSRTSKKNSETSVSEPEIICKMEDSSGSCDFKTSKDDKHVDNKEVKTSSQTTEANDDSKMSTDNKHVDNKEIKTSSQTTEANGASSSDSKADGERQPALTKASQKIKKSEPASSTQTKPNEIRGYSRGAKQSVKVDMKDQHFSKVGQWSSLRGSSFRQDKHHDVVQSNARGYVRRAHSSEKSLDPSFHSAYFNLSGKRDNFHFFFKRQSPFSQHFMSEFEVDEVKYNCCEQFMMQQKALTFKDEDSAKRIMATTEPNVQKRFGRQVKNFDGEVWNRVCMEVVKKGNLAKFSQNPKLKETLLKTGSKVLVEASPYDRIWGIGLDQDHADALFPEHWLGENRLGRILMEVRDELSKELKPK